MKQKKFERVLKECRIVFDGVEQRNPNIYAPYDYYGVFMLRDRDGIDRTAIFVVLRTGELYIQHVGGIPFAPIPPKALKWIEKWRKNYCESE